MQETKVLKEAAKKLGKKKKVGQQSVLCHVSAMLSAALCTDCACLYA